MERTALASGNRGRVDRLRASVAAAAAAAGLAGTATGSAAQDWPTRNIRLVVAFSAGGTADVFARLIEPFMSAALGQQIVVENRPGSSGTTGSAYVAGAEPDGHTLLMCGSGPQITAPLINSKVGYDPVRDFTHLAMVAGDAYVLIANAEKGYRSIADLKARTTEAIATASPGTASLGHLLIEQAKRRTGLALLHVPYKSSGDGIKDLLGNHIGLVMSPVVNASGQLRGGKATALGLTAPERNPGLPDVPTFKEQGYDVTGLTWFWLCGPKGLPAKVTERLSQETRRIVKLPQVKAVLDRDALISPALEPAQLAKFIAEDIERWRPLIREAGVKMP